MSDQIFIKKGLSVLLSNVRSPLATWEWSSDSEIITCSETLLILLNIPGDKHYLTVEEQTGFFNYKDLKLLYNYIYQAYNHGQPFEIELQILPIDKNPVNCIVYGYPVQDKEGKTISINGSVKDITRLKADNAILQESRQYQKALFESGNEAFFILDSTSYKIADANHTAEIITAYSKSELKQFTLNELCADENGNGTEKITSHLKKTMVDESTEVFECLIRNKEGKKIWLEVFAKYLEIEELSRIVLSARDISARKTKEKTTQVDEMRQKFLMNISLFKARELNELLDYILGEVLKTTKSTLGYIQYFNTNNEGTLLTKNLKDRYEVLSSSEKQTLQLLENHAVWSDIVLLRRPVIDNNFNISLHLKEVVSEVSGMPLKYMSIPVFKNNRIVATIGVTNTKRDYKKSDVEQFYSYMNSVWEVIDFSNFTQNNTSEDNIFASAIKQSPFIIEQYNMDGIQIAANEAYEKLWGFPASTTINSFNILKSIEIRNSELFEYVKRAYSGEKVQLYGYEFSASFNSDERRWFNTHIYPIRNSAGIITGITLVHEDITPEKSKSLKIEEENKAFDAQQTLLLNIIDALPVRVFWKDAKGKYMGCNQAFATDARVKTKYDIIGKTDEALNWSREQLKLRSRDIECLKYEGGNNIQDYPLVNDKGETIWFRTTVMPVKTPGKETLILGIYDDVTEIKEMEKTLAARLQSNEQGAFSMAELILKENLDDIYAYTSKSVQALLPDSVVAFTSANQSETKLTVKHIHGLNKEQEEQIRTITDFSIQGKNLNIFPTNYEIYKKGKVVEFSGGLDLYFGIQFPSSDARKIENLLSINYIYTVGINQGDFLLGVMHLFSRSQINKETKNAIESIARQAAFVIERKILEFKGPQGGIDAIFKTIENASDPVVITDTQNGIITAANAKSMVFFNRDVEDMIGFHYSVLFPAHLKDGINNLVTNAIKQNEPFNGEFWVEPNDKDEVPVILSTSLIASTGKSFLMMLFQNIEKRKQAEALTEQNNKELEQLISTKDKLFSIISHDLKNPLTGIVGFAEVVKDELEDEEDAQLAKFMDIIIRSADSMVYLINNLLHWSRIQQGVITPKFSKVDLSDIVEREFELLYTAASNKNINLLNSIAYKTSAYADREMISTVVRNLVSNAIKFTPNDGSISVECNDKGEQVEISITDTGVGMEKADADKLFKIDSGLQKKGTAGEKGTGLGLVICKDFIEQNNGTIEVDSELNKGTTFRFTIPKVKE